MATGELAPFKQLLRLIARAFYREQCPPRDWRNDGEDGGPRSKLAKVDTAGLGVVILDYLLDREWVGEEQITTDLGQHHKVVRRALKYLEEEHLLMVEHRRETKRLQKNDVVKAALTAKQAQMALLGNSGGKASGVGGAGGGAGAEDEEDEEQQIKQHTYSYWAIDYPRAFDMIQYRLLIMRKLLKDELDAKEVLAKYVCKAPHCIKEFDSYDMPDLIQFDGTLKCSVCGGVVEQVFASGQTGDDEQRRARRARLQQLLKDTEEQVERIAQLTHQLRNTQPPHQGSLTDWAKAQQARLAGTGGPGGGGGADGRRMHGGVTQLTAEGGAARTALYQETHVQVTFAGGDGAGASGGAAAGGGGGGGGGGGKATASLGGFKAPTSAQPFFLKRPGAAAAAAPAAAASGSAAPAAAGSRGTAPFGAKKEEDSKAAQGGWSSVTDNSQGQQQEMDDYTQKMLASMAQPALAAGAGPGPGSGAAGQGGQWESPEAAGPPAKRFKKEEAAEGWGVPAPEPEPEPAAQDGGGADADEVDWEEI